MGVATVELSRPVYVCNICWTLSNIVLIIQVISDQHPKSLLILDDVWNFEVARAFAVRCRTMVTSRNSAVASGIPTPQIHSVSVSEGKSTVAL